MFGFPTQNLEFQIQTLWVLTQSLVQTKKGQAFQIRCQCTRTIRTKKLGFLSSSAEPHAEVPGLVRFQVRKLVPLGFRGNTDGPRIKSSFLAKSGKVLLSGSVSRQGSGR